VRDKVTAEALLLLQQMEEPGGQKQADVFINEDTVLHLEIVRLI
jgi:hypothetical protein